MQCSTLKYNIIQSYTVLHNTIPYSLIQSNAIQSYTIQCHTICHNHHLK